MMTISDSCDIARCATGIRGLDEVTEGGLPEEGMTMVWGVPGSGVSSLGMEFLVRGAREFKEQGLYLSFEERTRDLLAQFAFTDWNLPQLVESGGVRLDEIGSEKENFRTCRRPQCFDLDALLTRIERAIDVAGADRVVLDGVLEFMNPEYEEPCVGQQEFRRLFRRLKEKDVTMLVNCSLQEKLPPVRIAERQSDCVLALERMARIDRNVLRIGVFELLHVPEVPPKVAISEAIELVRRYSTEKSGAFINGILDRIWARHGKPGRGEDE